MVQVLPDDMVALRKSLLNMDNRDIGCGPVGAEVRFFLKEATSMSRL